MIQLRHRNLFRFRHAICVAESQESSTQQEKNTCCRVSNIVQYSVIATAGILNDDSPNTCNNLDISCL